MHNQTVCLKPSVQGTRMLYSAPTEQLMFFVRRFVQNADWMLDLLSLTEKLLRNAGGEINRFERLIVQDYLQFRLLRNGSEWVLVDRSGYALDTGDLLTLRDQILTETEKRALFLYFNPSRHPLPRAFKQVLAKSADKDFSEQEHEILRQSYLQYQNGTFYTLRGKALTPPSRSQRWIWKMVG